MLTRRCARAPGTVRSAKMKRTIIIRRDYMHYIKKYMR
jgi:ribosomal protein S17